MSSFPSAGNSTFEFNYFVLLAITARQGPTNSFKLSKLNMKERFLHYSCCKFFNSVPENVWGMAFPNLNFHTGVLQKFKTPTDLNYCGYCQRHVPSSM